VRLEAIASYATSQSVP